MAAAPRSPAALAWRGPSPSCQKSFLLDQRRGVSGSCLKRPPVRPPAHHVALFLFVLAQRLRCWVSFLPKLSASVSPELCGCSATSVSVTTLAVAPSTHRPPHADSIGQAQPELPANRRPVAALRAGASRARPEPYSVLPPFAGNSGHPEIRSPLRPRLPHLRPVS